jgi:ribosome-associated protein
MMDVDKLLKLVTDSIDDVKAVDVKVINVREKTSITDYMVIATGTSSRHVKAIAQNAAYEVKKADGESYRSEGEETGEWILVDFHDVVLHVMLPDARTFYSLEKLWEVTDSRRNIES